MSRIVAAASILHKNKILIAQRKKGDSHAGQWEFPGGTCRKGEEIRRTLVREIREELGLWIKPGNIFDAQSIRRKNILVVYFLCSVIKGTPRTLECQQWKWVSRKELRAADLCPADRLARPVLLKIWKEDS